MEKLGRAGQATDDYIVRRTRSACWIPETTYTHTEYVNLLFLGSKGFVNVPQYYVYTYIERLVITKAECVYCALRTEYLNIIEVSLYLSLKG